MKKRKFVMNLKRVFATLMTVILLFGMCNNCIVLEVMAEGPFGPTEDKPYFIELFTEGIGHVEVPEGYPEEDYFAEGNMLQIRSENSTITVDVFTNDDPVVEHRLTGINRHFVDPDSDDSYSYVVLIGDGACSWAAYDAETKKLTFTLSEGDMQFWGVTVFFEGPGFGPSETCPNFVELLYNNDGTVRRPEGVQDEDCFEDYGIIQVRTAEESISFVLEPVEDREFMELRRDEGTFPLDDLINERCPFASYDESTDTLTINFSEENEIWGVEVFFGNGNNPGPGGFGPSETCPYFIELFTEGIGHVEVPEGYPEEDYFTEGNMLQIRSENSTITVDVFTNDDPVVEHKLTGINRHFVDPDSDDSYSYDDLVGDGACSWAAYDAETKKLTFTLSEGDMQFWGVTVFFEGPGFGPSETCPNFVELLYNNDGMVRRPEGVQDEDCFEDYGIIQVRTAEESISFVLEPVEDREFMELRRDEGTFSLDDLINERCPFASYDESTDTLTINFSEENEIWGVEVFFGNGNNPGPGGEDDNAKEKLKAFIEGQTYIYGDWDGNDSVTADDLKLGIAQQIFYPEFNNPNGRLRAAYPEISNCDVLMNLITIGERDSANDIVAVGGDNQEYTIPAYKYTFAFTDAENSERDVNAEGIAWLFAFDGESTYAMDSIFDVVMELTKESGEKAFFLRNCMRDSVDCINPVTKEPSQEGAYCAVGDYKVVFDAEKNAYSRSVRMFGNGASLDDFLMTEEDELELCTFQGRNEAFAVDTGHSDSVIFGKFSFYQSSFTGMKIQGSGAAGNTPAWSFATDPVWGSNESSDTEKEAIVYFGNEDIALQPIKVNDTISEISELVLADSTIPEGAVEIRQESDTWHVSFHSNFYDRVEFAITYETASGPKTEYIWIHRVGIDIQATTGGNAGESKVLMHGTEDGPTTTLQSSSETLIYATYYYPEEGGTDDWVDLYATYTWKDGSVTREVISNSAELNLAYRQHGDDVQSSDFILYQGSKANAPASISVSAVVAGFDSTTAFTGMKLGSGKGVCWNNNIEN